MLVSEYGHGIVSKFIEQVKRFPNKVAIVDSAMELNYKTLDEQSDLLANKLPHANGTTPQYAGVMCTEGYQFIISILAILKCGYAYLPLDPTWPAERLSAVIKDSDAAFILSATTIPTQLNMDEIQQYDVDNILFSTPLAEPLPVRPQVDNPHAYLMYTSGSTGIPKGVKVKQSSVLNLVCDTNYIEISPKYRISLTASLYFDASTMEIWGALLNGATIVVIPRSILLAPEQLSKFLDKNHLDFLFLTTSLFHEIAANKPNAFKSVKHLLVGGEALKADIVRKVLSNEGTAPKIITNGYGPTECTTLVTYHHVTEANIRANSIPIGKPVKGVLCYVLNDSLKEVKFDELGELCVAGCGVAEGYLNRKELTEVSFVNNPYSRNSDDSVLYRTGDLVRKDEQGNIFYIGRKDKQIKIRGFRVELEEIIKVLMRHPAVKNVHIKYEPHSKQLIAYIVGATEKDNLLSHTSQYLPEYMVPAEFIYIDNLPLTSSGKVNENALPKLGEVANLIVGQDEIEQTILNIGYDLLGYPIKSTSENLVSLGFHSLLLMRLVNQLSEKFNITIELIDFLKNNTIDYIVSVIKNHQNVKMHTLNYDLESGIISSDNKDIPLSFQQLPLWFIGQIAAQNLAYNAQFYVHFRGSLNIIALEDALTTMVGRHEIWRTTFHVYDNNLDSPIQRVHAPWKVKLDVIDLSKYKDKDAKERFENDLAEMVSSTFDLSKLPLIKWSLYKISENEHFFVQIEHHFLHDGWSVAVFANDLKDLYHSYTTTEKSKLEHSKLQYRDFVIWQRAVLQNEKTSKALSLLREKFSEVPQFMNLPTDFPRPAINRFLGERIDVELPQALYLRLKHYNQKAESTVFAVLISAFSILLNIYSDQDDMIIGTTTANRSVKQFESLMGMLVNTFIMNLKVNNKSSFHKILLETNRAIHDTLAWQDLPMNYVVKELCLTRTLTSNPLFQVMFGFHDSEVPDLQWEGLDATVKGVHNKSAKMDINVICIPKAKQFVDISDGSYYKQSQFLMMWEYNIDLFKRETIEQMISNYISLIDILLENSESAIDRLYCKEYTENGLKIVRAVKETQQLGIESFVHSWNNTKETYPDNVTLVDLFTVQVSRRPDNIAVIDSTSTFTYNDVNVSVEKLSSYIHHHSDLNDSLIAIFSEKGVNHVIGTLAIMKAGKAFLPLNADWPVARIRDILNISGVKRVLISKRINNNALIKDGLADFNLIVMEDILTNNEEKINNATLPKVNPDDIAYVIFTSGSTGKPKGVTISHRGAVNTIHAVNNNNNVNEEDKILAISDLSFDLSIYDIFGLLAVAGSIIFPTQELVRDPLHWLQLVKKHQITIWNSVPQIADLLADEVITQCTSLKFIRLFLLSGDWIPLNLPDKLKGLFLNTKVISLGGATEGSIWSIWYEIGQVEPDWKSIPYGVAMPNQQMYILEQNKLCNIGEIGEIHIGGLGVALNYWNDAIKTASSFYQHSELGRLYKTGDLGRWNANGYIEFIGRNDQQIKIRGFRVEIGEIEYVLSNFEGIKHAIVIYTEEHQLISYYVADNSLSEALVFDYLKSCLPDYMIPNALVFIRDIPLTVNGKLDRKALPQPVFYQEEYIEPKSEIEIILSNIYASILNINTSEVGITDDFFKLGGDSMLAMRLISKINKELNSRLQLADIFKYKTITLLIENCGLTPKEVCDANEWTF